MKFHVKLSRLVISREHTFSHRIQIVVFSCLSRNTIIYANSIVARRNEHEKCSQNGMFLFIDIVQIHMWLFDVIFRRCTTTMFILTTTKMKKNEIMKHYQMSSSRQFMKTMMPTVSTTEPAATVKSFSSFSNCKKAMNALETSITICFCLQSIRETYSNYLIWPKAVAANINLTHSLQNNRTRCTHV